MSDARTILFAGGGSGGHIFPNIAVLERIEETGVGVDARFVVSSRAVDATILSDQSLSFVPLPVRPFSTRPWHWPRFYKTWRESRSLIGQMMWDMDVAAVVATGGFASGPVVAEASRRKTPVLLVNLDATPGRANRTMAPLATHVFTCYPSKQLPTAERIGLPIRRSALVDMSQADARGKLSLDPTRRTLFITGASQGANTLNQMMLEMTRLAVSRAALSDWQIIHLTGADADFEALRDAYASAGLVANVLPFLENMGLAWAAADIAVSRAGAGSVAEVWANGVPTIFFPYPWHKDQHQKLNAEPLVTAGAAVLLTDRIDPTANARQLTGPLTGLMNNPRKRDNMRRWMAQNRPPDGAQVITDWLLRHLK